MISQQTLNNLLSSKMPNLSEMDLSLDADDDMNYFFPDNFLDGSNFPSLKGFEVSGGFKNGEEERLKNSKLAQLIGTKIFTDFDV